MHKYQERTKTDIKKAFYGCCDFCFQCVDLLFMVDLTEEVPLAKLTLRMFHESLN